MMPALPIALMIFGTVLAVYGYTRKPAPGPVRVFRASAVLRLLWDLAGVVVQTFVFAAFAFGPRHAKYPTPLTPSKARDVIAGRATSRPGRNHR